MPKTHKKKNQTSPTAKVSQEEEPDLQYYFPNQVNDLHNK